jgi:ring-1,2-phenylacetyl-CoA epoxidase subunit PaaD
MVNNARNFRKQMLPNKATIYEWLQEVADPEIPVLTVLDMGIVREVNLHSDAVEIVITPTYSGCPAMDAISFDIRLKLMEKGIPKVIVTSVLSPAWTTDWMTSAGKEKLAAYGIAPPVGRSNPNRLNRMLFEEAPQVPCPRCSSSHTKLMSEFGSTACKALYQCEQCKEPFDYFKCH